MFLTGQVKALIDLLKSEKVDIVVPLIENIKEQTMKYKGITIHKRKNCNTWYTRFRKNNQVICISAKTQKECYELLKERYNQKEETINYKKITLIEWYNQWLTTYKQNKVRESTLKGIQYLAKNHFKGNIFNKTLEDIKPIEIENYLNKIEFPRVKENIYIYLKDMFNRAKQNNLTPLNPLESIDKPKHDKQENRALTIEEQTKFEQYCLSNKKYIYLICLWQGLRLGELRALTKDDIDLNKKEMIVNKSQNDQTKDNKTKNKHSNRTIPIFNNTLEILKNYEYENNKLIDKSKDYIERHLKEILNTLNIKNITMHSLRHTFITRSQEKNIPLYIIQSWVGHAKGSNVTTKTYTHKQQEIENKYINIFNEQ